MRFFILLPFVLFYSLIYSQTSNDDCLNSVHGKVIDNQSNTTIPHATVLVSKGNEIFTSVTTDSSGNFSISLPCDNDRYIATVTLENFTKSTKLIFTSRGIQKKHSITLDIYPIKEFASENGKKKIIVNPIHFIPDDDSISSEAAIELRKVCDIMNKYTDINVEIGFHSDSRCNESFLTTLTQKRADACASYLINKGVESERIIAKGFGSTKLLNECERGVKCSNAKHLINKRSEFLVFKKDLSEQMTIFE